MLATLGEYGLPVGFLADDARHSDLHRREPLGVTSRTEKVHPAQIRFHRSRQSTNPPVSGVVADGRRADVFEVSVGDSETVFFTRHF